jgi:hypothetical protein
MTRPVGGSTGGHPAVILFTGHLSDTKGQAMFHCFCAKLPTIGRRASIGLVLAAMAITAGCGRSHSYTDSEGRQTTVTRNGQDAEVTFKGKDGEEAHVAGGAASVPLPDGFPKDIAIYTKGTVFASTKDKCGAMSVFLKTADPMQQVMTFYQEKLKESGWATENTMNLGNAMMLQVTKEGRKLNLSISGNPGDTMVNLVLEKEKSE